MICYCFARAASIAAMSIFRIVIIAFIARLAAARSDALQHFGVRGHHSFD
jgi:hypothetical protein